MLPLGRVLLIVTLSVLIGAGRAFVPGHELSLAGSYEAFAHIWVGVLIGLAMQRRWRPLALAMLAAITSVEIYFFANR